VVNFVNNNFFFGKKTIWRLNSEVVGQRVTVVGREWCQSIRQVTARSLVVVRMKMECYWPRYGQICKKTFFFLEKRQFGV
jgi:hypothetical protein